MDIFWRYTHEKNKEDDQTIVIIRSKNKVPVAGPVSFFSSSTARDHTIIHTLKYLFTLWKDTCGKFYTHRTGATLTLVCFRELYLQEKEKIDNNNISR